VPPDIRRARDHALLDRLDRFPREAVQEHVWRVARKDRDPLLGAPSVSRWCNGTFEVLYFTHQPIFPSKIVAKTHRITVAAAAILRIDGLDVLAQLGVDVSRFKDRNYQRTQEIADAAYFLGFDGLIAPSARWSCSSLVLFTDRITPENLNLAETETDPVDWDRWKEQLKR
jgi:hypothetical protein